MNIEWALVFFTLFVGLSVGTFAGVVLTEWWGKAEQVRLPGAITALVALVIGGISSVLHLGHPERIFGALGHPTSGIFTEALLIGLFGLDIVAYMIAMRRNASGQARKTIATIGLVPAILLSFGLVTPMCYLLGLPGTHGFCLCSMWSQQQSWAASVLAY